jgi:hypothetical protein
MQTVRLEYQRRENSMFKKLMLTALLTVSVVGAFIVTAAPVSAFEASERGASPERGQLFEIEDFSFDIEQ